MRACASVVAVVAISLLTGAACGDDDSAGSGSGDAQATGASDAFCDVAAEFQAATTSVRGIASADEMQASLDQLDDVAAEAPDAMADEFDTLTGVLERLMTAMRATEDGDNAATVEAMQKVLTPETAEEAENASRNVEAFLEVECGIDGDASAADNETGTTETPPTSTAPADPDALGTDPTLDPLATACHDGDMVTCDELYFASPADSPYEAYGNTCGQRTTLDEYCVDIYPPPDEG